MQDSTTRLLSLVAIVEDALLVWIPPERAPEGYRPRPEDVWPDDLGPCPYTVIIEMTEETPAVLHEAIAQGYTFAAHNAAGFDALAYRLLVDSPEPEWYDTLPCARAAGLPGSLDDLGERIAGRGKDAVGKKSMLLLSCGRLRHGEPSFSVGTDALWDAVLRYNVLDVVLLQRVYAATCDYGEPDVIDAHLACNARGVRVDDVLADALRFAWGIAQAEAAHEVERLTAGKLSERNIRSVPTVQKWIASRGIHLDSLDKRQVARLIDDPEELIGDADADGLDLVVEVLHARQVATRSGVSKLQAARDAQDEDGRVRDALIYYGAATGRWTGRGLQPHNLTRGSDRVDVWRCLDLVRDRRLDVDELRAACPGVRVDEILSSLTRPVFCAAEGCDLLIVDYSAIEARGVAWCAGDVAALDVFHRGDDPYLTLARSLFGRPVDRKSPERQVAKVVELGCGYGMSGRKLGIYARQNGIDFASVGTTPEAAVKLYREVHAPIKRLWYAVGDAALDVVSGRRAFVDVARCRLSMRGDALAIVLPSGRPILYRDARVEDLVPVYCAMLGLPETPKPTVTYAHPRGYRKGVYGGLLVENIVQAVCRDLLAGALVRCEAERIPVILHVHDEIVAEVRHGETDSTLSRLAEIMVDPPQWADGFPIAVEGFASPRYAKSPPKGAVHVRL